MYYYYGGRKKYTSLGRSHRDDRESGRKRGSVQERSVYMYVNLSFDVTLHYITLHYPSVRYASHEKES